jgi:Flp pilus assembly protein TadB
MNILHVVVASMGAGMGGSAVASYRGWRERRRALPAEIRNAGILTDRRAAVLHVLLVGGTLTFVAWLGVIVLVAAGVLPLWMLPLP